MDTPEAQQAMYTGAEQMFGKGDHSTLWVNGLNSPKCAIVSNSGGPFALTSSPCSTRMWSFCENLVENDGTRR
jgi:hypothetical protein